MQIVLRVGGIILRDHFSSLCRFPYKGEGEVMGSKG